MEQRQIPESREVLQLSCDTNNLKKKKSEVSSRLIDRMLSRSGVGSQLQTRHTLVMKELAESLEAISGSMLMNLFD